MPTAVDAVAACACVCPRFAIAAFAAARFAADRAAAACICNARWAGVIALVGMSGRPAMTDRGAPAKAGFTGRRGEASRIEVGVVAATVSVPAMAVDGEEVAGVLVAGDVGVTVIGDGIVAVVLLPSLVVGKLLYRDITSPGLEMKLWHELKSVRDGLIRKIRLRLRSISRTKVSSDNSTRFSAATRRCRSRRSLKWTNRHQIDPNDS